METVLAKHSLFQGVEPALIGRVIKSAYVLEIERGDTAYERQRFRRCLGVVLEGVLSVRKEALLVSTLRTGDLFGAAALFNEEEEYPTVLTARSDCRLLLIPQESVRELICDSGAFAENYVSYLSGRIRFLSRRLDTLTADRCENQLASYLLSADGEDGEVTISATQLSQRLCVGRATLYRAFEVLEGNGVILREGKTIRIVDRKKLQALGEHV